MRKALRNSLLLPGLWLCNLLFLALLLLPIFGHVPSLPVGCLGVSTRPDTTSDQSSPISIQAIAASCLPWRRDLWESAGSQALQSGDAHRAIEYFGRAQAAGTRFGRPPENALSSQGWMDLGEAYWQAGDMPAALRAWEMEIARSGLSEEMAFKIGQGYQSLSDYPKALAYLQFLVDQHPQDAQLRYQLGLLMSTQDPESALVHLEQAANLNPQLLEPVSSLQRAVLSARFAEDLAYTLLTTGRALAMLDQWDLASEAFRQACLKRPDYAEAWAYWGEALQHTNRGMETVTSSSQGDVVGLAELEKAVSLDPKSLAAQTFLALYWLRQADYNKALDTIRQALDLSPDNPVLVAEMASILAASGDLDEAYKTYQRAAALSPYEPAYMRYLVNFALQYDYQIEQTALPVARELVIQDSRNPNNLDLMAQVLIRLGDLVNAERFLVRALRADPGYVPAHLHLGLLYLLQGNQDAALQELNLTITLDPDSLEARRAQQLLGKSLP